MPPEGTRKRGINGGEAAGVGSKLSAEIPGLIDKQGGQLLAVLLVLSRTWISDRIASLKWDQCFKYVLEQEKAALIKLIGISVLQSAANSIVAASLRNLASNIALGWRIHVTNHLLVYYLERNAFYMVSNMPGMGIDADLMIQKHMLHCKKGYPSTFDLLYTKAKLLKKVLVDSANVVSLSPTALCVRAGAVYPPS